jgi:hypothetical protein
VKPEAGGWRMEDGKWRIEDGWAQRKKTMVYYVNSL